jgi:formylglycine-generating enzyme required for sulfatase activity
MKQTLTFFFAVFNVIIMACNVPATPYPNMVNVEGGTFTMGGTESDEKPPK